MHSFIRTVVLAVFLLFNLSVPAMADTGNTKASITRFISKETKDKVATKDIIRMVKAVFTEATKHNIDPFTIVAMISTESTYKPTAKNKSGAKGLMQVIPRWHKDKIKGRDIFNIETNVEVGVQILADCLERHSYKMKPAFRCYSGGAKNYTQKVREIHQAVRIADIQYRFEKELPLAVSSNFDEPSTFSISVNTEPITPVLLATLTPTPIQ